MKSRFRSRRGYTLIEVATSVVIVAALTATIVPVVVKQIEDAAPTRLSNDLFNIAKGIELFHLNLGPTAYPSNLFQLTTEITTSTTASGEQLEGGAFIAKDLLAWRGPYITLSVAPALDDAGVVNSAFTTTINQRLRLFNSLAAIDLADGFNEDDVTGNPQLSGFSFTDADYIALRINNLTTDEFDLLDVLIDGEESSSTGRLRYTVVSSTIIAYFLAMPISR